VGINISKVQVRIVLGITYCEAEVNIFSSYMKREATSCALCAVSFSLHRSDNLHNLHAVRNGMGTRAHANGV
jgi:hypothetical protein